MTLSPKSRELMQHGPIVSVDVRHHPAAMRELQALEIRPPDPETMAFLVDTGAATSMIDRAIVERLGVGAIDVGSAAGVLRDCPTYRVELLIRLDDGDVALPTTVVGLPSDGFINRPRYRGILGRSSLQKARFVYDGAAGSFQIRIAK